MATIDIHYVHARSAKDARTAVEHVAERMAEKFRIQHTWDGDHLDFHASGVTGRITLGKKVVHVNAKLGFLLSAFKGSIEAEINRYLEREFG